LKYSKKRRIEEKQSIGNIRDSKKDMTIADSV
jgi:hypothetical protein